MFKSLRSRLWLSYAVLILTVLCIFSAAVAVSILESPVLYRGTVTKLRAESTLLAARLIPAISAGDRAEVDQLLERAASASGSRFVWFNANRKLLFDTGSGSQAALRQPKLRSFFSDSTSISGFVRDTKGKVWIYTATKLQDGSWLVDLIPRPTLIVANIFRNDIIGPLILAGGFAILVSVILTLLLAQSFSAPLKRLSQATAQLAADSYPTLPPEGPEEVRQVAKAFNEMSDRVRNSQQSQKDFIANVSHELKTPLTSIQGFAQAILDGTVHRPDEINQAANIIQQEAGRLHRLVVDLLALTRLESGTADLQTQPVNAKLLLQSILDKFELQARQARIELDSEIQVLPVIYGDGDRLAQVFTNLVDNALKFTPAGGKVTLSAAYAAGKVIIRVADSGIGITSEDQQRIFERFFQADKARSGGSGRGVGLGLAISRQIILAHHGDITLESEPGKGTVFQVILPVMQEKSQGTTKK